MRVPVAAWPRIVATAARDLSRDQATLLAGWAARGWPAIVRRRDDGGRPEHLPLGVPLPFDLGKARVALRLDSPEPIERRHLVSLADALADAPDAWRPAIHAILDLGRSLDVMPRVFGALLWQHLTGLAYLHAASDLDLLWPSPAGGPTHLLDGLRAIDGEGAVRLDGEIELGGGAAVNWRELDRARDDPGAEVLVKSMHGIGLRRVAAILEAQPC